ncbi:MAG: hypothetical protein LUI06_06645 [Ruminococcus sp.]|nr:hypothetical protein [Ruminococcus sp.]
MEEEIYKHKKELTMCIVLFLVGAISVAGTFIGSGGMEGYGLIGNILGTIIAAIIGGIFIGGMPIAWMKLPKLPFSIGGSIEWAFLGFFIWFVYHMFGAVFLGWLYICIYIIRDIAFLIKYNNIED